ncbi:hypothetical protein BDF19DRAFT_451507, partial [Syncephalis fuscata]
MLVPFPLFYAHCTLSISYLQLLASIFFIHYNPHTSIMVSRSTTCTSHLSQPFLSFISYCLFALFYYSSEYHFVGYNIQHVCMLVIYNICFLVIVYVYRIMRYIALPPTTAT